MACNEKNLILAVLSGPCKEFLDEAWEECLLLLSLGHLSSMFLGMAMFIVLFSEGSEFVICSTYYLFLILKVTPTVNQAVGKEICLHNIELSWCYRILVTL